jgi:hypothetical protein
MLVFDLEESVGMTFHLQLIRLLMLISLLVLSQPSLRKRKVEAATWILPSRPPFLLQQQRFGLKTARASEKPSGLHFATLRAITTIRTLTTAQIIQRRPDGHDSTQPPFSCLAVLILVLPLRFFPRSYPAMVEDPSAAVAPRDM